jgi:4-carboxymuconolactone decarboxylase
MNKRFETGRKIRAEVLGETAVRERLDEADSFNRDFQELITEYCWGAGWGRKALVRAALRNGVTRDDLEDALIQVGIYCGIPAGVEAFRIASRVLQQLEEKGTTT